MRTGSEAEAPPDRGALDALLARIEDGASLLAVLALTAVMLIIVVDVFMRYALNAPLTWAYELISNYLIPVGFFFVLAQTMRFGEHISVDFFIDLFSPEVRRFLHVGSTLASAAIFVVMTAVVGLEAWRSMIANEHTIGYFVWPIWLSKMTVPIGIGLLTLRLVVELTRPRRVAAAR